MPSHTVRQGECISSIAARSGLTEEEIYNHPSNASLRKSRSSRNVLNPGDRVFVPDTERREEICATARVHRFIVRIPKVDLRIILADHTGKPFAGRKFRVSAPGLSVSGTTGSDGLVKVSIPATLETAMLSAWLYEDDTAAEPDAEYELHLGHLDCHDTITGIQARLQNLGYGCPVSGNICDATRVAINQFLLDHNQPLAEDGADPINPALCSLLSRHHEGHCK